MSNRKKLALKTIARVIIWPLIIHHKRIPKGVWWILWLVTFLFFLFFTYLFFTFPPKLPQEPYDILFLFFRHPGYILALAYILITLVVAIPGAWSKYKQEVEMIKKLKIYVA